MSPRSRPPDPTASPAAREGARVLGLVTAVRPRSGSPGRIAAYLAAAGVRLVTTRVGWSYADCPACRAFAQLTLDADGLRWRSSCGCFGRFPLGEPEAVALFHRMAGHAS